MKILKLTFQNLNSLYGKWSINFQDDAYLSGGIFALTGPTGAGKSTILDAICLALYGATPRLGHVTKATNEIMSRQTGECSAEVEFESQAGRFRCTWRQHRARKNPRGPSRPSNTRSWIWPRGNPSRPHCAMSSRSSKRRREWTSIGSPGLSSWPKEDLTPSFAQTLKRNQRS